MKITTALAAAVLAGFVGPAAAQTLYMGPSLPRPLLPAPPPMVRTCTTTQELNAGKLVVIGPRGSVSVQQTPSDVSSTTTVCRSS